MFRCEHRPWPYITQDQLIGVAGEVVGESEQIVDACAPDVSANDVSVAVQISDDLIAVINVKLCVRASRFRVQCFCAADPSAQDIIRILNSIRAIRVIRGQNFFKLVLAVPADRKHPGVIRSGISEVEFLHPASTVHQVNP